MTVPAGDARLADYATHLEGANRYAALALHWWALEQDVPAVAPLRDDVLDALTAALGSAAGRHPHQPGAVAGTAATAAPPAPPSVRRLHNELLRMRRITRRADFSATPGQPRPPQPDLPSDPDVDVEPRLSWAGLACQATLLAQAVHHLAPDLDHDQRWSVTCDIALLVRGFTALDGDLMHLWPIDSRSWHRLDQANLRATGLAHDVAGLPPGTGTEAGPAPAVLRPSELTRALEAQLRRRPPPFPPRRVVHLPSL